MQHEREEPEAEREVAKASEVRAARGREASPQRGAMGEIRESQEPESIDDVLDTPPRPAVDPVVVPRWVQLVTLPLAIVGLVALLSAAGPIVLLFTIAALVALLLNPFVTLLRRLGIPRGAAVLITWVGLVLVVVGVGVLLANPIADQVTRFQHNLPGLIDDATKSLDNLQTWLDKNGIKLQIQEQGQSALQTIGDNVARG